MEPKQAIKLGNYLRAGRVLSGMSMSALARQVGIDPATMMRFEKGQTTTPAPEKLGAIAEALDLDRGKLCELAGYPIPELPAMGLYLRKKYDHLPEEATEAIERYAARMARKHGTQLDGPGPGEDED